MSGANYSSSFPRRTIFSNRYFRAVYVDLNVLYTLDTNQIIVENIDAINVKILNLITTSPGERPFEPTFGCDIPDLLFAPTTPDTAFQIMGITNAAFVRWLPEIRLDLQNSNVFVDSINGAFYLTYSYSVIGLSSDAVASFTLRS